MAIGGPLALLSARCDKRSRLLFGAGRAVQGLVVQRIEGWSELLSPQRTGGLPVDRLCGPASEERGTAARRLVDGFQRLNT